MIANVDSIVAELTSRDGHRIWSASHSVIRLRDRTQLVSLGRHVKVIERATRDIDLGGALRPNSLVLEAAIRRIHLAADSSRCLCDFYLDYDQCDPEREATAEAVVVVSREDRPYAETYVIECTACQRRFNVERFEYHYPWWKWTCC